VALSISREVRQRVDRLDLPFNAIGVDPYGISKVHLRRALTILGAAYRHYFTVETLGAEHIPAQGRAMLVGNHSGGIALDAAMVVVSCLLECNPPRLAQGMAEKFLGDIPFLGEWSSRTGQLPGLPENAARLLEDDRLLLVFPEGARGTAKLYRQRYSLVHFGSGFVRLALKTKTPVIPFAVLGAGEAFPTVANSYKLGKVLGVPYVPLVAYGLPALLPAKIEIEYAPPLHFEGTGNEDDTIVLGHVDKVKAAILSMVTAGAMRRRGTAPKSSVRGEP